MMPLAAPLIDIVGSFNGLTFELVGPSGTDKSIAQQIAGLMIGNVASVATSFATLLERPGSYS